MSTIWSFYEISLNFTALCFHTPVFKRLPFEHFTKFRSNLLLFVSILLFSNDYYLNILPNFVQLYCPLILYPFFKLLPFDHFAKFHSTLLIFVSIPLFQTTTIWPFYQISFNFTALCFIIHFSNDYHLTILVNFVQFYCSLFVKLFLV